MQWNEPLDEILGSRAKVRILRCLAIAEHPLSAREIARRAHLSHTGAAKAVAELEQQDVVWPSSDRSGHRFRLNLESELVTRGLLPLLSLEASLDEELAGYVRAAVPEAISITIFGSAARGDDRPRSDLDVFVVVPDDVDAYDAEERISSVEFYARFGKVLSPLVFTAAMVADGAAHGLPVLQAIEDEGRLVFGRALGAIIAEGDRVAG